MATTRAELRRMFILNVVCDDYENLEMIRSEVDKMAPACGLPVTDKLISAELCRLIQDGLVSAYLLSSTDPVEALDGVPPDSELDEYYYFVTKEGRALQLADFPDWPFEEELNLKRDWTPPIA